MIKQLASESVIYGLVLAINQLSTLLLWPVYTRVFTASDLASVVLATTILAGISIIATMGLDNSAHRWYWELVSESERKTTISTWFWAQLGFSTLFGVILAVVIFLLTIISGLDHQFANACYYIALLQPFKSIFIVLNNWFRMQRKPKLALIINSILLIFTATTTVLLIYVLKNSWTSIFLGSFIANMIIGVGVIFYILPVIPFKEFNLVRLQEMLKYSVPLIPAGFAGWFLTMSDRWLLSAYLPKSEVSIYQIAVMVAMLVGFPMLAFQQAWAPFAMSIQQRPDAKDVYVRVAFVYCLIFATLAFFVAFFSQPIITLVFSSKFSIASSSVLFLCFAQVLTGLYYIAALGCNLAKNTTPIAIALFFAVLVQIIGNLILLPRIGRDGAAISMMLAQGCAVVYLFWSAQRIHFIPYLFLRMTLLVISAFIIAFTIIQFKINYTTSSILILALLVILFGYTRVRKGAL